MEIFSIRDYFYAYIGAMSLSMTKENLLEPKELEFLVECCVLNSAGGNLNNFDELWGHFSSLGFFKRRNDCSTYKKKLGEKRWIRGKRNVFTLPKSLDVLVKEDGFLIWNGDSRKKVPKLKFNIEFYYGINSGKDSEEH